MNFFMAMRPPTVTAQERCVRVVRGRPVFYDPPELRDAREALSGQLAQHSPEAPFTGPLMLRVMWLFPITGRHEHGEWKTTRPDTDNLQKLLKDCMTDTGYWKDDAQVCVEHVEKRWANEPCGIYVEVSELEEKR